MLNITITVTQNGTDKSQRYVATYTRDYKTVSTNVTLVGTTVNYDNDLLPDEVMDLVDAAVRGKF